MVFSSVIFLWGFLPLTLLLYYTIGRKCKNVMLLLASLFFYAWGEPRFVLIMMGSILVNWGGALLFHRKEGKGDRALLILLLVLNLGLLFVYKYVNFIVSNINAVAKSFQLGPTGITLPIGISFFTFQALSYVIDVYRGDAKAQKNPLNVALYISLFPQLIAGPIVRYRDFEPEIRDRKTSMEDFTEGIIRFLIGLGKKVLLANTLALFADQAFGQTGTAGLTAAGAWIGAFGYALQLYFDFSGYSDMAIGLGRMFGFHFNENFNYPYRSLSVTEFWRRWHISLSSWFRDYVYIPLGGNRSGNPIRNLLIVWVLTGIWHGANWTFIVWGLMYFVALALERTLRIGERKIPGFLRYLGTGLIVLIGWVIFRSNSMADAAAYLERMFSLQADGRADLLLLSRSALPLLAGFIGSLPLIPWIRGRMTGSTGGGRVWTVCRLAAVTVIGVLAVICVISATYNPFIYFHF